MNEIFFRPSFSHKQINLLETAELLFANRGYHATSIRHISKEAGTNSAMISYYFGSKEELMLAILAYRIEDFNTIYKNIGEEGDPLTQLFRITDYYVVQVFKHWHFYLLISQLESLEIDGPIIMAYNQMRLKNYTVVKGIVKHGQQKGIFKKDIDILLVTSLISGMLNYLVVSRRNDFFGNSAENQKSEKSEILIPKVTSILMDFIQRLVVK